MEKENKTEKAAEQGTKTEAGNENENKSGKKFVNPVLAFSFIFGEAALIILIAFLVR